MLAIDPSVSYLDNKIESTGVTKKGYLNDKKRRHWDDKKWATGVVGEGVNGMTPKGILGFCFEQNWL